MCAMVVMNPGSDGGGGSFQRRSASHMAVLSSSVPRNCSEGKSLLARLDTEDELESEYDVEDSSPLSQASPHRATAARISPAERPSRK